MFVPDEMVVGAVVKRLAARTTLANERVAMATRTALGNRGRAAQVLGGMELDVAQQDRLGRLILLAQAGALLDSGSPGWPSAARIEAQSSVRKLIGVRYRQALAEYLMRGNQAGRARVRAVATSSARC